MSIIQIYENYAQQIDNNFTGIEKIKIKGSAFLLSLFIIIAPVLICYNLLIFYKLQIIIAIIMNMLLSFMAVLYTKFSFDLYERKCSFNINEKRMIYIFNTLLILVSTTIITILIILKLR